MGSFLNVLIFRFPNYPGLISGRSKCRHCQKTIPWFDLIPVLSFLILGGRCRNCRQKLSLQYPLVEIACGGLFVLFYYYFGLSAFSILLMAVAAMSIVIFTFDIKSLEIPEVFAWLLLIFAIVAAFLAPNFSLANFLLGGLAGGGILGILVGISDERWMGAGDIKIGLAFGFLLGLYGSLLFLMLAFVIGAVVGVILITCKNKKMSSQLAFSPFLIIAGIIAIIWGERIVNWYLKFAIM